MTASMISVPRPPGAITTSRRPRSRRTWTNYFWSRTSSRPVSRCGSSGCRWQTLFACG
ncbi:MAG: hypothetical protein MZV64_29790 [Ignavibacteriales bacterium]|nr:hypothetical protein [Ignavibacteriales bacterium]